jgi:hypothetical protein
MLQFAGFVGAGAKKARTIRDGGNPGSAVVYRQTNETKKLDWIVRL